MGMYQPEIETMDRNEIEKLQLERLQSCLLQQSRI